LITITYNLTVSSNNGGGNNFQNNQHQNMGNQFQNQNHNQNQNQHQNGRGAIKDEHQSLKGMVRTVRAYFISVHFVKNPLSFLLFIFCYINLRKMRIRIFFHLQKLPYSR
jgi:hypothetical protein